MAKDGEMGDNKNFLNLVKLATNNRSDFGQSAQQFDDALKRKRDALHKQLLAEAKVQANKFWFDINLLIVIAGVVAVSFSYWRGDLFQAIAIYFVIAYVLTRNHTEAWYWHLVWPLEYLLIALAMVTVGAAGGQSEEAADELKEKEGE